MARRRTVLRRRPTGRVVAVLSAAVLISATAAEMTGTGVSHADAPGSTSAAQPGAVGTTESKAPPIVGGQPANMEEAPWTVYLTDEQGNQFCGGTLARENKVVTAAHCVESESAETVQVVSGRADKNSAAGTVTEASDLWVHPEYQGPQAGADLAVVTLSNPVPEETLELATSADTELYAPGTPADVYGWGSTSEGGQSSDVLRSAQVPLTSDPRCAEAYGGAFDSNAMVCAGVPEGGVDSCQGDSGGPLVAGNKLIGVVSWGDGCARPDSPGVYTRVASYADDMAAQLDA